jgi:hypothetical protein
MQVCPICSQNAELSHEYDAIDSIFEGKNFLNANIVSHGDAMLIILKKNCHKL